MDTTAHCTSERFSGVTAQNDQCEIVRNVADRGNNMETRWTMETNNRIQSYNNRNCRERRDAIAAIARLENIGTRSDTMVTEGSVRIDLQSLFNRNDRRYANIQIQINRPRTGASDSTTIATALVEIGVNMPIRYVRDALIRSLTDCQPRQCWLERQNRQSITNSDVATLNQGVKFPSPK